MSNANHSASYRARKREAGEPIEDAAAVRARAVAYRTRKREAAGKPPRRVGRKPRELRPFIGVDGEGSGRDRKGRQHYMLMCAANADVFYELYTGKPLSTYECLDFLTGLPGTEDAILSGFSFGYDVTMILRDLPSDKWADLMSEKDALPNLDQRFHKPRGRYTWFWPPAPRGLPPRMFGIEYLPHNYFRVCRMETVTRTCEDHHLGLHAPNLVWRVPAPIPGSSRTIYEGFGFFQKSFARSLDDFKAGTVTERRMIARNKAARDAFTRMTREVRDYCALECELLADMMSTFRTNCLAAGIKPRTWNGPGKLATALHHAHGTMTADKLDTWVPSGLLGFATAAYYGGRFELPRSGHIPGPVWYYDLNSAYPAAMGALPCLEHGRWTYCDGETIRKLHRTDPTALYVATVAYRHGAACRGMCGLPHRQTGRETGLRRDYAGVLAWPLEGAGTYWSVELRSAELLGATLRFGSGWRYSRQCDCQPFNWIDPLYQERLRLGKSTAGYPLKLGINSLYGKLAQRIGNPRYANAIWAGLITATTRARLNEAVAQNPGAIAMIATDGIFSVAPLDLTIGKALGQWGVERFEAGMFTVQPGLWWSLDKGAKPKTRGVSAAFFKTPVRNRFQRAWSRWHDFATAAHIPYEQQRTRLRPPAVEVKIRLFVGRNLAEARGKPETAGMWIDAPKTIDFEWAGKRGLHVWQPGPHVRTHPLPGGPGWVSASYDAEPTIIDLGDMAGEDFEDQPDYLALLEEG